MAALRKPSTTPLKRNAAADDASRWPKRRAGMLDDQDVGEHWLEVDVAPNATVKKAKILAQNANKSTRYVPREQRRSKENDYPNYLTQLSGSSNASGFIGFSGSSTLSEDASSPDAFELMMNPSNKVSSSTVVRQRQSNKASSSSTKQSNNLLHAGFVQFKGTSSHSSTANVIDVDAASGENEVSSTRIECEQQPVMIPKLLATGSTFKVRVNEQLLNVPVNNNMIGDLTIGWLAEETSRRYYK